MDSMTMTPAGPKKVKFVVELRELITNCGLNSDEIIGVLEFTKSDIIEMVNKTYAKRVKKQKAGKE